MAVIAYENDRNGSSYNHVLVYAHIGNYRLNVGNNIFGESIGDNSGSSIKISSYGKTAAVGAYDHYVYCFKYDK